MSTKRFIGASLNQRQVNTITIASTWAQNDTVTLTIDSVDFVITIGTQVTTAQVATTIQQALSGTAFTDTAASCTISIADGGAALIPQFSEFTATVASSVVTLTSNGTGAVAGKPFTITVTGDGTAGSGTATMATSTSPTSQYHADQADNYSANGVPTGGSDTLIFDNGSVDVRWGLDYATTLTAITKYKSYTGNVGLPEVNVDTGSKPYHDYRTTYLTCTACTTVNLEVGDGQGSGRFKLNTGSAAASTINVFGKGQRAETGVPCILWKGTHASSVVNNLAGDVGIAFFGGETATVATLTTGDGSTSGASTICGSGCTLTTATLNGGTQETNSTLTTANQYFGSWVHKSGTVTTANIYGGTHYPNGGSTYTTLNLYGTFDASKGAASFAITNTVQLYKGAKFIDPLGRAGNVVFKLNGCLPSDVTLIFPPNKTYTLS